MSSGEPLGALGQRLVARRARATELELYEKRGRSRRFSAGVEGESFTQAAEEGWAARGGSERGAFFVAATGRPPTELQGLALPTVALGRALRLPEPDRVPAPPASATPKLDAPLATEREGFALLAGIARELERELPGARTLRLRLDDGASAWALRSSRRVAVDGRHRATALRVDAAKGTVRVAAEFVARDPGELKPLSIARRLADRLLALDAPVRASAPAPPELVLAGAVVARLVEALVPGLVGPGARATLERWGVDPDRFASRRLSLVDDGSDPRGALATSHDGEGVPCRARRLVEHGRFVAPLVAWWESDDPRRASGVSLRPGWRDLPRRGATQLFVEPDADVAVGELVGAIARGAYLVAVESGVELSADRRALEVAVSGFELEAGRATGSLGLCRLRVPIAALFADVRGVARDLTFVPGRALYGAPTIVVGAEGFELAV